MNKLNIEANEMVIVPQELKKVLIKYPRIPDGSNIIESTQDGYKTEKSKKFINPLVKPLETKNQMSAAGNQNSFESEKSRELIKVLIKNPAPAGQTYPMYVAECEIGNDRESENKFIPLTEHHSEYIPNTLISCLSGSNGYSKDTVIGLSDNQELVTKTNELYNDQSTSIALVRASDSNSSLKLGEANNMTSAIEKTKKPNAFLIAEQLLERYQFALYKESIYVFCGNYYRLLEQAEMCRLIKANFMSEACASGTNSFLTEVCNFIYHDARIIRYENDFNQLRSLIAFRNGFLNVQTGIFCAPDPKYFFLHYIDVDYNVGYSGDCPYFKAFLRTITNDDEMLIRRIWEMVGYIFSNDVSGRAFFLLQGVRRSGKSTLGEFICSFFPDEAQTALGINELANNFALGNLHGKAICVDLDLPDGKISFRDIGKLKNITGNDTITADVKFKSRVKFKNRAKLLFATNHAFELMRDDPAVWERLHVIPFNVSIPRERSNYNLIESFATERLAIVKEAISHYCQLVLNNYNFSGNFPVNGNVVSYKNKDESSEVVSDVLPKKLVENFVTNCCLFVSDKSLSFTSDLFNAYIKFYANQSIKLVGIKAFSKILNEEFNEFVRKERSRRTPQMGPESCYYGIVLRENFISGVILPEETIS